MTQSKSQKDQQLDKKRGGLETDWKPIRGESNLPQIGEPKYSLRNDPALTSKNQIALPQHSNGHTNGQMTGKPPKLEPVDLFKSKPLSSATSQSEIKQLEMPPTQLSTRATISKMGLETVQHLIEHAPQHPSANIKLTLGDLQVFRDEERNNVLNIVKEEFRQTPKFQSFSQQEQDEFFNRIRERIDTISIQPQLPSELKSGLDKQNLNTRDTPLFTNGFNSKLESINLSTTNQGNCMVPIEEAVIELGIEDRSVRRLIKKNSVPTEIRKETVETFVNQEVDKLYVHLPTLMDHHNKSGRTGRPKQKNTEKLINRLLDKTKKL